MRRYFAYGAILGTLVVAQEFPGTAELGQLGPKKVGPRTPIQRLESLVRFSQEWLGNNLYDLPSYESWKTRFIKNSERMLKAFGRDTCKFFDPSIPHGGPNPNPRPRPDRKRRKRTADIEVIEELKNANDDDFELFDDFENLQSRSLTVRYDTMNPLIGIKQITTGFRKWALRYIAECHGQRKFQYQKNRMNRWFEILSAHYVRLDEKRNKLGGDW